MGSRIAALPPDPSGFEYCSLVDVVDKHPMLEQVRGYLAKYDKGSDEYYKAFFGYFPLQDYLSNRDSYMKNQVTEVQPEDPKNGYSAVYRNSLFPEKIVVGMDDGLLTGYERFNLAVRLFPNNHCLGCREYNTNTGKWSANYVWDTYKEVQERCLNLGSGILTIENMKRGKPITDNDFIVALMSPNRKEWVLTDLACQSYSITNTMLYDTLGSETSEYIMNLTEAPVIVLDKPHLFIVLALIPNLSWLNTIIIIEPMDSAELTYINTALLPKTVNGRGERITVFCMEQVEQIGKMNRLAPIPPKPESVYCVNFTSGSTGVPKGVELTHLTYSCAVTLTVNGAPMPRDIQVYGLCVLPLAHVYQRQLMGKALLIGVGLGFLHGPDPSLLLEDMRALNPHQLALVPRIVNKLQMLIEHSLKPDELELIQEALKISLTDSDVSGPRSLDPAKYMDIRSAKKFKALVSKIRRLVGWENMVFLVSGGAPISPGTLSFIRIAVDLRIRQGYGLTETFGAIFVNEASQIDYKTCGCLSNTAELRLKSIPEMGYDAVKNRMGEVQVRGPHVFRRYLKADEQTKDAFEEGGWLKTGDIGSLDPLGRIQIIDRVKNIFKLAQGEYIVPEKIENIYLSSCPFISQIFIHGSSLSHYLVAIVGIDPLLLGGVLEKMGVNAKKVAVKDIMYLINTDLKLKKALLMLINSYAKSLQGFEKVANMYVDVEPLKISEGTITPTFKCMRSQCRKRFGPILEHLYNEGSLLKMENL